MVIYTLQISFRGRRATVPLRLSDTVYRRNKEVYYRLDEPIEGDSFISSHFFKRSDEGVAPRINAMADLAWFIATLLLKVPFEPQRNAMNDDVKEQLRRAWNSLPDERGERSSEFRIWFEHELNVALDWVDKFLKDVCYLIEGRDVEFKNRLKAMVFDGCLRLMAFQYARLPDVSKWQYHPDDIASCLNSWTDSLEENEVDLQRIVFAAMIDLRTNDDRLVLHYSESRWKNGVLRYSPFGGGLQVSEKGKEGLDGFGEVLWLGKGDDVLDLRIMVPASITSEVIQWFSNVDASLREHTEGAWRELREELMEETSLLSSLNLEDHVSPLKYFGRFQTEVGQRTRS